MMFILSMKNYSQVSISPSDRGADDNFEKGQLENFKKTTTVFVLSNVYSKEDYEKILKEAWTVTPFILVDYMDFEVNKYANGNYSIAKLYGDITVSSHGTRYMHTNLIVRTIDSDKFQKKFSKLDPKDKKYLRKLHEIFIENSSIIAKVPLSVNNNFLTGMKEATEVFNPDEKLSGLYKIMYTEKSFTNMNLGMLKNYFQQISKSLSIGEHYGLYDDFSKSEIKNLKENILYIPDVYKMKYDAWGWSENLRSDKEVKELLEDYKYKYEFISDADLERKILNNETIYYLRYVSMNANKYLQVVNAKSGTPVYYFYGAMTYNLKDGDFESIYKSINKANKSK